MKQGIHPKYEVITVKCGCGNTFETRSTIEKISVEVCSNCHPFYTGKQKFVDTAGRVERFQKRWKSEAAAKAKASTAEKKIKKTAEKVIFDLRDKIAKKTPRGKTDAATAPGDAKADNRSEDAIAALVTLGYGPADARKTIRTILDHNGRSMTIEGLIREGLSQLMNR